MTFMIELTPRRESGLTGLAYDQHRLILSDLIAEGIVLNYAESNTRDKFWVIMTALSSDEVIEVLSDLSSLRHLTMNVIPLFTNESNPHFELVYSLN